MVGLSFAVDLGGEEITILTAGTKTDAYSGQSSAEDWGAPVERTVTTIAPPQPFELQPAGEPVQDARNALTSGWVLYLPHGDSVTARDRVRVRGVVYPVQGKPSDWGVGVVVRAFVTEG